MNKGRWRDGERRTTGRRKEDEREEKEDERKEKKEDERTEKGKVI